MGLYSRSAALVTTCLLVGAAVVLLGGTTVVSGATRSALTPNEVAASIAEVVPEALAPTDPAMVAKRTVDPSLRRRTNALVATGTLVPTQIRTEASDGLTLRAGASTITLKPADVAKRADDPLVVGGDSAVFANTQSATDTAIRPTALGAEVFMHLRDRSAQESFAWDVSLYPGQRLIPLDDKTVALVGPGRPAKVPPPSTPIPNSRPLADEIADGRVPALRSSKARSAFQRVQQRCPQPLKPQPLKDPAAPPPPGAPAVRGAEGQPAGLQSAQQQFSGARELQEDAQRLGSGSVLAVFNAAWARDADGDRVPLQLRTNGRNVTLKVAHRGAGVTYPVVADPTVAATPRRSIPLGAAVNFEAFFQTDAKAYVDTFLGNFDALVDETNSKMYDPGLRGRYRDGFTGMWARAPSVGPDGNVDLGMDFRYACAMFNWARSNGKLVTATPLVWHEAVPPWLRTVANKYPRGSAERRTVIYEYLRLYITSVVNHFENRVGEWVVVNEAIVDTSGSYTDGKGARLRPGFWLNELGPDYIKHAFKWARAADPGARLYYNDVAGETENDLSNFALRLLSKRKRQGVPIDGVGFQMHKTARFSPSYRDLRRNLARFASAGFKVAITEMDVAYNPRAQSPGSDRTQLNLQRKAYKDAAQACRDVPKCARFFTWGVGDKYTWRESDPSIKPGPGFTHPLMFNRLWERKAAYGVVRSGLMRVGSP